MTTRSDGAKILEAAQVLSACRQAGAVVLRVYGPGKHWRLYLLNEHALPAKLKGRLLELQPAIMTQLRKLASWMRTRVRWCWAADWRPIAGARWNALH